MLWAIFLFIHCNFRRYWWHHVSNFILLNEFGSVYIPCYHISFLFSHHYLFLTETVGNMIFARSVAIWHSRSLRNDMFLSLCSKSILVCMHSNHVQNQSNVSAYPAEELRIEPVKWWSPREGLLINKGALLRNAPHHRMTAHSHYSETNEVFGKKWENYTETSNKNLLLIKKYSIAFYNIQINFIRPCDLSEMRHFYFPNLNFWWNERQP